MFIKIINMKTAKYASVVKSYRDENGKSKHKTLAYLGQVTDEQIPFLKAAYAKKRPQLVYDDNGGSL